MNDQTSSKSALLLIGGQSKRMGHDKYLISYHEREHWLHMYGELNNFFDVVYISCRSDQAHHFEGYKLVIDQYTDIGPIAALYSAFTQLPELDEFFVIPCDLPHFKVSIAQSLYSERQAGSDVWAVQHPNKAFPEPLIAIWNRSSLEHITAAIQMESYSLLRCLKKLKLSTIRTITPEFIHNVNSPEDL